MSWTNRKRKNSVEGEKQKLKFLYTIIKTPTAALTAKRKSSNGLIMMKLRSFDEKQQQQQQTNKQTI